MREGQTIYVCVDGGNPVMTTGPIFCNHDFTSRRFEFSGKTVEVVDVHETSQGVQLEVTEA